MKKYIQEKYAYPLVIVANFWGLVLFRDAFKKIDKLIYAFLWDYKNNIKYILYGSGLPPGNDKIRGTLSTCTAEKKKI